MQIFKNEDESGSRSDGFQAFGDFADHSFRGCTEHLALKGFPIAGRNQRGHLHEPCRCKPAQDGGEAFTAGFAAEPANGVQKREVSLHTTEGFQALTAGYMNLRPAGGGCKKSFDEGGFSNARLAGNKNETAPARQSLREPGFQASQRARAADEGTRGGEGLGLDFRVQLSDETVAAPMQGLDKTGRSGIVAQRFSDLLDLGLQRGVGNVGFRPNSFEQILLGDEPAGVCQEMLENGKSLWPEWDAFRVQPQTLVEQV